MTNEWSEFVFVVYPLLNNSQQMSFSIRFDRPSHSTPLLVSSLQNKKRAWQKKCIDLLKWTDPLTKMTIDFRSFQPPKMHTIQHARTIWTAPVCVPVFATQQPHNDLDLSLCYLCVPHQYTQWNRKRKWKCARGHERANEIWRSNKIQCQLWWAINGNFRFCISCALRFSMMKCHPFGCRTRDSTCQ